MPKISDSNSDPHFSFIFSPISKDQTPYEATSVDNAGPAAGNSEVNTLKQSHHPPLTDQTKIISKILALIHKIKPFSY